MTLRSGRITVTDTANLLIDQPAQVGGYTVVVQNMSNSKSVFLDGPNVTVLAGFELLKGGIVTVPVAPDEAIYAITKPGETVEICWLITKR